MSARDEARKLGEWLAPRWSRGGAALARPAQSAAAIRVPDRKSNPPVAFPNGSPQLFVHEGARQSLERKLKAAFPGRPVVLSITDNRHSIISHALKSGVLHARIHHMFLDAPPRIMEALARYMAHADRDASNLVGAYIDANGARLARRRPRAIPLETKGHHHDLLALFQDINAKYFDDGCTALVTWGRRTKRARREPRRAIKLGSYSSLERLIRMHPVLDKPWVPRYFVAYVLYHEMLHHMIPAARGNVRLSSANLAGSGGPIARRILHPPEFIEREQEFRRYERAMEWEKRHIGRLLRASG